MSALPEGRRSPVDLSGIVPSFLLGGEHFECVERLAPGAFLDLAASAESRYDDQARQAASFQRFMFAVVAEGEEPRLEKTLFRKRDPVEIEDLSTIVTTLAEWYATRPTQTRPVSANGRSRTTDSSTDGSPSPVSTLPTPPAKTVSLGRREVVETSTSDGTSTS